MMDLTLLGNTEEMEIRVLDNFGLFDGILHWNLGGFWFEECKGRTRNSLGILGWRKKGDCFSFYFKKNTFLF